MKTYQEKIFGDYVIRCDVIPMGRDCTIAVYGGERPHVGSIVASFPRKSLTGEGISVSSSVINGIGHKEESIARMFAEAAAVKRQGTAVCTCGIHFDNITPEQIEMVKECCERILQKVLGEGDQKRKKV